MLLYSKVNGEVVNQGEGSLEQVLENAFVIQEAAADEGFKAEFKIFDDQGKAHFGAAEELYKQLKTKKS